MAKRKDGELLLTDIGSPQGGVISPLLANIYLNYMDYICKRNFSKYGKLIRNMGLKKKNANVIVQNNIQWLRNLGYKFMKLEIGSMAII